MSILAPMVGTPSDDPAVAAAADSQKSYYLSKDSLTFPGVAAAAGTILRVIDDSPSKLLALAVAAVLGGALVFLGYARTPQAERDKPDFLVEAGLMGLLNVGLLWVAILGVAVVTGGSAT